MPPIISVEVIINYGSGVSDKEEVRRSLQQLFGESGVNARISIAHSGREVDEFAKAAVRSDCQVIVAGGGDGTMNAVAAAIIESSSDKILGVLPLGTLNHFAQDLRIPLTVEDAARVIIAGRARNIDVGRVNGHIFLNNSSLGLYPIIVRERLKQQRLGHGKWPAFAWAALSAFRRYPFLDVRLIVAGEKINCRTPFVFVGNNEYAMEGFQIGRRGRLDEGKLSLYITNGIGRLGLVRLALRALFRRLRSEKDFVAMSTEEVRIETRRRRLRVAFDGEIDVLDTPLHYQAQACVLRVMVPAREPE
ncbi:MAG: sphingosine kinase [Acidobacteria bacterium]|nr:sphingosine kinase [Acidobacteriota bacterium]